MATEEDRLVTTKPSQNRFATLVSNLTPKLIEWGGKYGKEVTRGFASSWLESFKDVEPKKIMSAMLRVERMFIPTSACPFPVPAHVWSVLSSATDNEKKITAESAWQKTLQWARYEWHPDLRNSEKTPLDQKSRRALCAAGGPSHIFGCSEEETQWARKRFIEAYEQLNQLEQDEFFLSDGEAKRVLATLGNSDLIKKLAEGKQLK